jgi:hypothetical protein
VADHLLPVQGACQSFLKTNAGVYEDFWDTSKTATWKVLGELPQGTWIDELADTLERVALQIAGKYK